MAIRKLSLPLFSAKPPSLAARLLYTLLRFHRRHGALRRSVYREPKSLRKRPAQAF